MKTHTIVALAALLASPIAAWAQDAPTSYELRIYAQGAPAPLQTTTVAATAVVCDQPAPAQDLPTLNPSMAVWDDPQRSGRVCKWDLGQPGDVLVAIPSGSYEAALVAVNAIGSSPPSNRAPFVRARPPVAVSGVRLLRSAP